jgi:predicted esterase
LLAILAVGLSVLHGSAAFLPVSYDANGFFHLNSGQSSYAGYKPDTYDEANPITLLVWLHGCGGYAEPDLWSVAPPSTRETQSYIAISIGGRDGGCWSMSADPPKVLAAITDVARYFNINPRRVFLAGYSSGGDLTYRVGLQNAGRFAGLLVENSDPFLGSGLNPASTITNVSWKINIVHLAHLSDEVYPIGTVRGNLARFSTNGFPVALIERAGTHYNPDAGSSGTVYDLIHYLLPHLDTGLEIPIPMLSLVMDSGGARTTVTSPAGAICVVSATTSLGSPDWIPLVTNTVPFSFVEPVEVGTDGRFYRCSFVR